ncbi:MAG: hypothetical protein GC178_10725 [Flavobacteriales bacterium]|nr:hypothetical protein [Flavobacteriales bacterium]
MLRKIPIILLLGMPILAAAQQELKIKNHHGGLFSLGMRTTISTFNHGDWQSVGTGAGGQFRLQLHDRINTEWFADYLTSSIGSTGNRRDAHIGWSVMYYPLKDKTFKKLMKPYIVMGHCFDYTKVQENVNPNNRMARWSSAIQGGIGNHFNLTEHFDLTFIAQYMIHLGKHVEAHEEEGMFEIHEHGGLSLEGHLLFTVGINYKIADLW